MFERLDNFRDFGGYPTRSGRRTATGRLFRSAHHAEVTQADLERLQALGITVFVDLRRSEERQRQPCRRPAGFAGEVIENDIGAAEQDAWLAFLRDSDDLTPESFRGFMRGYYRDAPYEARHIDLFTRYFDALAKADGGVLIHCAAGKDRTGILAALTHHLAGVPDEHIMHDYLLTNDPATLPARVQSVTNFAAKTLGRAVDPACIEAGLLVEAEYLTISFGAMAQGAGSVDAYLGEVLGVHPGKREAILARLVL